jgi:hypothetical protein
MAALSENMLENHPLTCDYGKLAKSDSLRQFQADWDAAETSRFSFIGASICVDHLIRDFSRFETERVRIIYPIQNIEPKTPIRDCFGQGKWEAVKKKADILQGMHSKYFVRSKVAGKFTG